MNRTGITVVSIVIILLLAAGAAVYYGMNRDRQTGVEHTATQAENSTGEQDAQLQNNEGTETETGETGPGGEETVQGVEVVLSEEIKLDNNSPEYDLKMSLVENGEGKTSIKLEYYYDGIGTVKFVHEEAVPEVREIFRKRTDGNASEGSYTIGKAWFNTRLGKVYFIINGEAVSGYAIADMYVITLGDGAARKIFSNRGRYKELSFSKDYRYLCYSYEDSPESSILQESILFEVIDCNIDELIIKNSRIKEVKIGSNINKEMVFDYTFKAWHSDSKVRLLQKPVSDVKLPEAEVLYDISGDLMLNLDGSVIEEAKKPDETKPQQEQGNEEAQVKANAESESALAVLKEFYGFLGSESEYEKAMDLLDETFVIKLAIFRQFGISELTKADITAEDAAFYSEILRAASFDTVAAEERKETEVTIYYYQSIELSPGNQVRQPMLAIVKKSEKGWKIALLQDADESQPPFKALTGS